MNANLIEKFAEALFRNYDKTDEQCQALPADANRWIWETASDKQRDEYLGQAKTILLFLESSMPSFEEVWAKKEAEGYQYGHDALEQVRFGWELRAACMKG